MEKPGWLDGQVDILGYDWPLRQVFTIVLAAALPRRPGGLAQVHLVRTPDQGDRPEPGPRRDRGIPTRTVDRITFFVGSGLAGVAGVAASLIGGTNSQMGTQYIIPAFLVVVAGGIGQIKGTVIAAWAVGIALSFFADWTTGSMAQVLAFVLVVVFLQFRPQGLFTVRPRG